jgi:hypothetical protein
MTRAAPLRAKVLAVCGDGEWRSIAAIAERAGLPVKSTRGILWHAARRQQARSRASTGSREYRVTILKAQRRCQQPSAAKVLSPVPSLALVFPVSWRAVVFSAGGDGGGRPPELPAARSAHVVCSDQRLPNNAIYEYTP